MSGLDTLPLDDDGMLDMEQFPADTPDLGDAELGELREALLSDPVDEPTDDAWAQMFSEAVADASVDPDGPFGLDDDLGDIGGFDAHDGTAAGLYVVDDGEPDLDTDPDDDTDLDDGEADPVTVDHGDGHLDVPGGGDPFDIDIDVDPDLDLGVDDADIEVETDAADAVDDTPDHFQDLL